MLTLAGFALVTLLGPEPTPAILRASVEKALPILVKGAVGYAEKRTCFGCHNQCLSMVAFHAARERGFSVEDEFIEKQAEHVIAAFKERHPSLKKGSLGGGIDSAGWGLYLLDKAGHEDVDATAPVVDYILKQHENLNGPWRPTSNRPPTQGSLFTSTYLAIRALKTWGTPEQKEPIDKRIDAAKAWLETTPAKDTEDRVYRLRALKAVDANGDVIRDAMIELRKAQRSDGGWGQKDEMPSDPYAAATALAALREAGGMPASSPAFKRGLSFLLRTQQHDGSWHVKTRSRPIQQYFESGFPHGKDQFISAATTAWAVTALVQGLK